MNAIDATYATDDTLFQTWSRFEQKFVQDGHDQIVKIADVLRDVGSSGHLAPDSALVFLTAQLHSADDLLRDQLAKNNAVALLIRAAPHTVRARELMKRSVKRFRIYFADIPSHP